MSGVDDPAELVFNPGDEVEWRQADGPGGAISKGTYVSSDSGLGGPWALVNTARGGLLVRPDLLQVPGVLAAEDAAFADLCERAKGYPIGNDEHAQKARGNGWPWCDTCKRPSVWSEFHGCMHTTAEHPSGVPAHLDDSGHEVTHGEWWRVPR